MCLIDVNVGTIGGTAHMKTVGRGDTFPDTFVLQI
jgi:hypothetical protein